jgi:glucuronosyltransferase
MLQRIIKISFILLATLSLASVNSYRILGLFPHPGESHYHFFLPVLRALTERGHNLTVVSHFPEKNPPANWHDLKLSGLPTMSNSVDLSVSI